MKTGKIVWLSALEIPFLVAPRHCLNLDCTCTDVWLRLTEVDLDGKPLARPLSFEVQVCLRHWVERDPPVRPPQIASLVREFLVEFSQDWIEELIEVRKDRRAAEGRLAEYKFASAGGELACYSDVISEDGGLASGGRHYGFFLSHAGHDYLIEDYYCPTPECDCRKVHLEFWERVESTNPRRIDIRQVLMATFTLEGEFDEVRFAREDAQTEHLLHAWREYGVGLRAEFQHRYQQIKAIGRRSFPPRKKQPVKLATGMPSASITTVRVDEHVGRNNPSPCGSGRKFKRCCARQNA